MGIKDIILGNIRYASILDIDIFDVLSINGRPVRKYILTLVQNSDDATTIRQKGGVVWQDFGDGICAAFLPMDSLGVLDQCPGILCMEANEPSRLMNDTSAVIIGVDKVLNSQFTIEEGHLHRERPQSSHQVITPQN